MSQGVDNQGGPNIMRDTFAMRDPLPVPQPTSFQPNYQSNNKAFDNWWRRSRKHTGSGPNYTSGSLSILFEFNF